LVFFLDVAGFYNGIAKVCLAQALFKGKRAKNCSWVVTGTRRVNNDQVTHAL
jgi:hypothetical protein